MEADSEAPAQSLSSCPAVPQVPRNQERAQAVSSPSASPFAQGTAEVSQLPVSSSPCASHVRSGIPGGTACGGPLGHRGNGSELGQEKFAQVCRFYGEHSTEIRTNGRKSRARPSARDSAPGRAALPARRPPLGDS